MHRLPRFFTGHGEGPMQPHIHNFYQIIWFWHGHGRHLADFRVERTGERSNTLKLYVANQTGLVFVRF
jgi:hypothetical protein